jgi:hypothetical protein
MTTTTISSLEILDVYEEALRRAEAGENAELVRTAPSVSSMPPPGAVPGSRVIPGCSGAVPARRSTSVVVPVGSSTP